MKTTTCILSLAVLLIASLSQVSAAPGQTNLVSNTVLIDGLVYSVDAVDPESFHIVAYQSGAPVPPSSPFVVESAPPVASWQARNASGDLITGTRQAVLVLHSDGSFYLKSAAGSVLLNTGTISVTNNTTTVALGHNAADRLYGAGNLAENKAGDLTHPSGTQVDANGVTRIPFLWSTGNWSALIANDSGGTSWADAGGTLTWTIPASYVDLYLSIGQGPYGLLNTYTRLTGRAPIPPKWTFGYLQSRWGYNDAADVQDKWQQFRTRQIPVDAFIYDYDWFVNDWQFNPKTFPDGSLTKMHLMGLHFVGIRKPRVNNANQDFAKQQGWNLNAPFGIDLRFDLAAARYWWWSNHIPLVKAGVDGFWNDEAEQTPDEFFWMTKTEWDGWRAVSTNRCWTLNRAFSPGMQRFGAAVWTGDLDSSWDAMSNQPGTLLNWQLSGMPYTGQDIGGFQSTPTPELYARWIEEGVFTPIMRSHGTFDSPRWPWAFGDNDLAAITKAIDLRYRLIPYIYTFASINATTGAPIMRPLFFEFPNDPMTYNLGDEWLLGDRLLAAPVLAQGGARTVYLPAGAWYDFNTGAAVSGGQSLQLQPPLDTIPAYVRAGSIIPLGPVLQYTGAGPEDPLEVRVYPGANASFKLYEDDGITYAYQNGTYTIIPMTWNDQTRTLTVGQRTGSYPAMVATRHFNIVLPNGAVKSITYSGQPISVAL
jgi:alpha-glucosidase